VNTDTMSANTVPNAYYLREAPAYLAPVRNAEGDTVNYGDVALWSGLADPPAVGTRVRVTMNGLGPGTVRGYFTESGWLGLHVELEAPPAWWVKQNTGRTGRKRWACLFGVEVAPTSA
jgi:hypothetical protein